MIRVIVALWYLVEWKLFKLWLRFDSLRYRIRLQIGGIEYAKKDLANLTWKWHELARKGSQTIPSELLDLLDDIVADQALDDE